MASIFGRGSALSKQSANMIKREMDEEEGSSQQDHLSSSHDLSRTSSGPKSETSSSSFILAQAETKMLKYSKLMILLLIAGIATVTSIVTYKFVRKQESDEYHAKVRLTMHCIDAYII
jgi:hypothetical protein